MPATHLLCYIRRNYLTSWKLDSLEQGTPDKPVPAYGSDDHTFAKYADPGNVLWVVGAHDDGPPSLEAKIEIASRIHDDNEWKCVVKGAADGSTFFGLNDASDEVMRTVYQNNRTIWSLKHKYQTRQWSNIYGRNLQAPRRIARVGAHASGIRSTGSKALEQLATRLRNRSVFISWKHSDNDRQHTRFIKALALALSRQGFAVWWDKLALTNVEAVNTYSPSIKDKMMGRLLRQGLSQSRALLAVWTDQYGTPSSPTTRNWTLAEWKTDGVRRYAVTADEFRSNSMHIQPDGVLRMPTSPRPQDAPVVARQFARAFEST